MGLYGEPVGGQGGSMDIYQASAVSVRQGDRDLFRAGQCTFRCGGDSRRAKRAVITGNTFYFSVWCNQKN